MRMLLLPVVLLAFAEDGKEAEKLFRAAEKKLIEADSAQIGFTASTTGEKLKTETKGVLWLARVNMHGAVALTIWPKSELEVKGKPSEKSASDIVIYDGTRVMWERMAGGKAGKSNVQDAPKQFEILTIKATTRMGILPGISWLRLRTAGGKEPDPEEMLKLSDFSLGKKEKVGDREARVLSYKVTAGAGAGIGATHTVQLWLDIETNLPLKRVVRIEDPNTAIPSTETYHITLNARTDKGQFELGKDK